MDGQGNGLEWRRPGASSQTGVTGTCGAKTRDGTPCAHPAGWGTDHPGVGRCKLHGGSTSRPPGLESRAKLASRFPQGLRLPLPLHLLPQPHGIRVHVHTRRGRAGIAEKNLHLGKAEAVTQEPGRVGVYQAVWHDLVPPGHGEPAPVCPPHLPPAGQSAPPVRCTGSRPWPPGAPHGKRPCARPSPGPRASVPRLKANRRFPRPRAQRGQHPPSPGPSLPSPR